MNKEIEIPEGYEARIEGNKVILEPKESEDERIGEELLRWLKLKLSNPKVGFVYEKMKQWIAYLEKQKAKEKYDRLAPIYSDQQSFEDALEKAWKFYNNSGSRTVDGFEDNSIELSFAKGFREGFLCKEKQKEQEKCPEHCVKSNCIGCSIYEKQKEQKPSWAKIDNSKENVVFPFNALVKDSGKIVTIIDGQLSFDGKQWIKFASNRDDGFKVYCPEDLLVEQNPAEWSEKDEKHKQAIIDAVQIVMEECEDAESIEKYKDDIDWLENRLKSLRPQPHWKPSEGQMKQLGLVAEQNKDNILGKGLMTLYNDLKKLM